MTHAIVIRTFQEEDVIPLTEVLVRMGQAGSAYPPPEDVDGTMASMQTWLLNEEAQRWVITIDKVPAGHVLLSPAHEYLYTHLAQQGEPCSSASLYEVGKFFVDPAHRKHGLGHLLLNHLIAHATEKKMSVALSVIDTSKDAIHFYQRKGFEPKGSFNGRHGLNYVFRVI